MSYGAVESLSTLGLSGWAINIQRPETSPLVGIWLDNELIGAAVASDLRVDVKDAGYSLTGRCGFRFVFPRPVAQERLSTLSVRLENGQVLPNVGSMPFDVFDLFFQGSYGRDTSIPMSAM